MLRRASQSTLFPRWSRWSPRQVSQPIMVCALLGCPICFHAVLRQLVLPAPTANEKLANICSRLNFALQIMAELAEAVRDATALREGWHRWRFGARPFPRLCCFFFLAAIASLTAGRRRHTPKPCRHPATLEGFYSFFKGFYCFCNGFCSFFYRFSKRFFLFFFVEGFPCTLIMFQ